MAKKAKEVFGGDELDAVGDRGDFDSTETLACGQAGIKITLPKPSISGAKSKGRFGKQDFRYVADGDVDICPAGNRLTCRYMREEGGLNLRRYWTNLCLRCSLKALCMSGKERGISRLEHEEVLEAVQQRLDENPQAMRKRGETAEHPFGPIKGDMARCGWVRRMS